jgi:hypothetical protein
MEKLARAEIFLGQAQVMKKPEANPWKGNKLKIFLKLPTMSIGTEIDKTSSLHI